MIRPPIERYIRCTVTRDEWTVEPGIEWRAGDDMTTTTNRLRRIGRLVASDVRAGVDPIEASRRFEALVASQGDPWHGRAFFVEIHDVHGSWTQTFQPYGIPRQS